MSVYQIVTKWRVSKIVQQSDSDWDMSVQRQGLNACNYTWQSSDIYINPHFMSHKI